MLTIFASNEQIDRGELLLQLKGEYARQCLDKIQRMNGRVVAIDFSRGQWPGGHGEHIWYELGETGDVGYAGLRTDDSCVSWTAMGNRWSNRSELIADVVEEHEVRCRQARADIMKTELNRSNVVATPV